MSTLPARAYHRARMSQPIISAENLGKRYRIHHEQREGYSTLRDVIARKVKGLFLPKSEGKNLKSSDEDFWALKGVSFEVQPGEVVGIIGGNGAGKSTLLKILSRITESTEGRVTLRGRVASLLEVGTGFHPELTGRENIFLNGAILGMTRVEIRKKFDEIVAFAEIDKFLDTPVKRYSSGMYVRLAFAVAAHLDPEVLVVDEVLAVGDAQFQKKCLGKMQDVSSKEGRTVLFVSHNIGAVRALCSKGIWLQNGNLKMADAIDPVAGAYMEHALGFAGSHTIAVPRPEASCPVWMESITALCNGQPNVTFTTGDSISFRVKFRASAPIQKPFIGYLIRSSSGGNAVNANNHFLPSPNYETPVTKGTIICELGLLPLMSGSYSTSFWLCQNPHQQHHLEDALRFIVEDRNIWGTHALPPKSLSSFWWPTQFTFLTSE